MQSAGFLIQKRTLALMVIVFLLFFALITRLFYLQFFRADELTSYGENIWQRGGTIAPHRGDILDYQGKVLAQSATTYILSATPKNVEDAQAMGEILGPILDMDPQKITKIVGDTTKGYVYVKRQVPRDTAEEIRALIRTTNERIAKEKKDHPTVAVKNPLKGLSFEEDSSRFYPMSTFLSQTLGITNVDGAGQSGLELVYDKYLTGVPGSILSEVDGKGRDMPYSEQEYIPAQDGNDVVTTIDYVVQSYVDKAMRACIEATQAKRVQAIVMDVNTGAILAMTGKPDFDLNDPPRNDASLLDDLQRNRIISDVYEPGSTFKIITTSAAINENVANRNEGFVCTGSVLVDGDRIRCWRSGHPHGAQTLEEGLMNSCNPVFVDLALRLGKEKFYRYMRAFGLGKTTGIDLTGESAGIVRPIKYVKDVDLARVGFGQSVAVTPLQLITAASAAVNGGNLMKPYLVSEIRNKAGEVIEHFEPEVVSNPITPETSKIMREMLLRVVRDGGAHNAFVPGFEVGGKTGTAQKYREGKIVTDVHVASFVGFAPADNPRFAVLVIVDEAGVRPDFGGTVAAPYAKMILEDTLNHLGYAPAQEETTEKNQLAMPELNNMSLSQASQMLEGMGLTYLLDGIGDYVVEQMPPAGTLVPKGSIVVLYTDVVEGQEPEQLVAMPDVLGCSIVEANRRIRAAGLTLSITGSGLAVSQDIAPGTVVKADTTVHVVFQTAGAPTPKPTQAAQ